MTVRERVARAWHEGSDHAKDGTPFGGPLCNCWQVAERIMPMLAGAWRHGANDAWAFVFNGAQTDLLNPYETEEDS